MLSTLPSQFSTLKMTVQHTQRKSLAEHQEACGEVITEDDKVPVIDFAGLEGPEREMISQQIAKAAETWGFFQVVNHGMDPSLMKSAKAVSKEFFYLPEEEISKIKVVPGNIEGWNHSNLSEAIGESKLNRPDSVEHLYLVQLPDTQEHRERYPLNPPSYRSTIQEYVKEIKGLHEKILVVLSEMLGLSTEALKTRMTTPLGQVTMRTNFYRYREGEEQPKGVCHAHSDPGGLTLLLADDVPGLEVRKDGRWVPVNPIPGAFIVNVGDSIEMLSNGRYKSVEHRGLPNRRQERLTMASFYGSSWDVELGPIAELLDENHPPLYKTCTFGEYVMDFIRSGLDGKNGIDKFKL